jgi:hypothetical protein
MGKHFIERKYAQNPISKHSYLSNTPFDRQRKTKSQKLSQNRKKIDKGEGKRHKNLFLFSKPLDD